MTARVRSILASEIGLAADVLGSSTLDRAINERMRALGIKNTEAYAQRLDVDRGERAELVEDVVVPETWFFRDGEPFRVVARMVRTWTPGRILRALSMPCATGEEPYSLVMTLVEDGFDIERIAIMAIDVSDRAIARARRGIYGRNSFRGGDTGLMRQRHFRSMPAAAGGEEWQLDERIRRVVDLQQGNALTLTAVARGPYDVILCRNLLIYLTTEARARVLASLLGLLAEDGVLIVGHADLIDSTSLGLQIYGDPAGFAYARAAAAVESPAPRGDSGPTAPQSTEPPYRPTPISIPRVQRPPVAPPPPAPREEGPVARARALADRGDLKTAADLLSSHLDRLGPDGDAYHLLGMIESARGDRAAAEKHLSRALYCDPSNQATLIQLALLAEQRGDETAAANFRRRAQRLRGGRS